MACDSTWYPIFGLGGGLGQALPTGGTNGQILTIVSGVPAWATGSGTVDATALHISSNLSDLGSVITARSNLGLGSIATQSAGSVAITGGTIAGATVSGLAAAIAIADGGTGQITAQLALNALAGAVTNHYFLAGNGTNVTMRAIAAADVPTLNQSTTGNAANVTGTVAIANGGTGQITQQLALNAIAGAVTANYILAGDGTNVTLRAMLAAYVPT